MGKGSKKILLNLGDVNYIDSSVLVSWSVHSRPSAIKAAS
jgi:hypothetical protein